MLVPYKRGCGASVWKHGKGKGSKSRIWWPLIRLGCYCFDFGLPRTTSRNFLLCVNDPAYGFCFSMTHSVWYMPLLITATQWVYNSRDPVCHEHVLWPFLFFGTASLSLMENALDSVGFRYWIFQSLDIYRDCKI